MSAILSFEGTLYVLLLTICTATYVRQYRPSLFHRDSTEMSRQFLYKCSVVGDRLSPYISVACVLFGLRVLLT